LATLTWLMHRDQFSYLVRPEYNHSDSDDGNDSYAGLSASADWNSRELMSSDLRAGINGRLDGDYTSIGAYGDWGGRYGRARGQVERVDRDNGTIANLYNGNLSTSFIVAEDQLALGGKEQNQAAVVVDLQGDAGDSFFDIMVNGGRVGTARAGTKTVISLRPFESYSIRLNVRGNDFVYFDDEEHKVTLYPGNVVTLNYRADKINIIFGRIQDPDGKPVANALLKGVSGLATTDEFGVFQAEIIESVKEFQVQTRTSLCSVTLPEFVTNNGVASVGNLRCD
jgi:outer membrane usher protein FimD/PapC